MIIELCRLCYILHDRTLIVVHSVRTSIINWRPYSLVWLRKYSQALKKHFNPPSSTYSLNSSFVKDDLRSSRTNHGKWIWRFQIITFENNLACAISSEEADFTDPNFSSNAMIFSPQLISTYTREKENLILKSSSKKKRDRLILYKKKMLKIGCKKKKELSACKIQRLTQYRLTHYFSDNCVGDRIYLVQIEMWIFW